MDAPDPAAKQTPARVVGIGASAGGVDALIKLVAELPGDLPHAICVVLHVSASGTSMLGRILDRYTDLNVVTATGGERLRPGCIFVAPPDRHVLIVDGHLALTRGPKENGVRPAVDVMLRSLAAAYGPAAVAVILSGALGDGSNGALAVAQRGGTVIVQDPGDAIVPSMPERAVATVGAPDLVLPVAEIGAALAGLEPKAAVMSDDVSMSVPKDLIEESRRRPPGPATGFTCPECSGALWEVRDGDIVRYRCRIGHAYSEDAMLVEQGSSVEAALWTALEVLEERAELLNSMAERRASAHPRVRAQLEKGARDARDRAEVIRRVLASAPHEAEIAQVMSSSKAGKPEA